MLKSKLTAILPLVCASLAGVSQAQVSSPKSDLADRVVPVIEAKIAARYPFPDIADRYVAALSKALQAGRYKGLTGKELAKALNADIQSVHKDLHLGIHSSHALFLQANAETGGPLSPNEKERERLERHEGNFGFTSVEVDPRSDTAYIKSAGPWWPEKETFEIAAGTMAIASESHNIIIDVRGNSGGSGAVGRFLASYFYEPGEEKFYLDGFGRTDAEKQQEWTFAYVPGRNLPHATLYILIDKGTGSAAEGFAFAMQKLHRATVVGERSAGAGIAGSLVPLEEDLVIFLPYKMVVAPGTSQGWEGTGVSPDVPADGKDARSLALDIIKRRANGAGS